MKTTTYLAIALIVGFSMIRSEFAQSQADPCLGAQAAPSAGEPAKKPEVKTRQQKGAQVGPAPGGKLVPPEVTRPETKFPKSKLEFELQTGSGPIPDITDWQPRTMVSSGAEIRIQGRNLDPDKLVARWGGNALTRVEQPVGRTAPIRPGQSVGEVRFRAPATIDMAGKPLVSYHIGGQPRTLETAYKVFDPVVRITRVSPSVFQEGQPVTLCGTSLFNATTRIGVGASASGPHHIGFGDNFIQVFTPAVSPSGDRMTFVVGRAAEQVHVARDDATGQSTYSYKPRQPQPPVLNGAIKLASSGVNLLGRDPFNVTGPQATWFPASLALHRAYNETRFFGKHVEFVIMSNRAEETVRQQITFEGTNLSGATFRIGGTGLPGGSVGPPGLKGAVVIPDNAPSGQFCATKDKQTACAPGTIQVLGAPFVSRKPSMPMAMFTNHTIEGINLAPAGVSGLTYEFQMANLDASFSNAQTCNRVMQIVEHSAQRITFKVGDPARAIPSSCLDTPAGVIANQEYSSPPLLDMRLIAKYDGAESVLWSEKYSLQRPSQQ